MDNIVKNIGKNIRKRRMELGLLQSELAERIGYSVKTVSKWECGKGAPPTEILLILAKNLQISIDSLLSESGEGEKYYLGIDGGGTKTEFALTDGGGNLLGRVILGACNPNDVGISEVQEVMLRGIVEVCGRYPKNSISAFAGFAGGASEEYSKNIYGFLSSFGFAKVSVGEDTQNSVAAGLGNENGIVVIMGTGSVVYAKQNQKFFRYGGYGYLLGDAGSGFAIGRDTVLAALMAEDGSGAATVLYKYVLEKCGGKTVFENIGAFYREGKRTIAKYAPLVFKAYKEGDAVACSIIQKNICELAALINSAATRFAEKSVKVVICGGMTADSDIILPMLAKALSASGKDIELEICHRPMVWGALRLAGMPNADFDIVKQGWN